MTRHLLYFVTLMFFVTLIAGCSDKVPLKGKVTFSDNGEPLPCGLLVLESGTFLSRAEIKDDGTFIVGSLKNNDGIPKGTYRISITGAALYREVEGKKNSANRKPTAGSVIAAKPVETIPLIDQKYERPETSGLSFTVDGMQKEFSITVERLKK